MKSSFLSFNTDLQIAFQSIYQKHIDNLVIAEIANEISKNSINKAVLNGILTKYNIKSINEIKSNIIEMLLDYTRFILNDHLVNQTEKFNFEILKRFFKIQEGDFYKYAFDDVYEILHLQFIRLYEDNKISFAEALHKVDLQELFDLSYDQFEEFKKQEIKNAIDRGADISDLDTIFHK